MNRLPLLFHPATLISLLVLVANDHWFKYAHPGALSGKASDFAGLVLVPMLIVGAGEALKAPLGSRIPWLVCGLTGLAFSAVKLLEAPNAMSETILGGRVLMDPWDLVALPALLIPLFVSSRSLRANAETRPRVRLTAPVPPTP